MIKLKIYQPPVSCRVLIHPHELGVLRTYQDYPQGLTDEELASLLGLKESSARNRRYWLQRRGLLRELPVSQKKNTRKLFTLAARGKHTLTGA